MDKQTRDALERAQRLQQMGIEVRSPEFAREAQDARDFYDRGGNRAMRRAKRRKQ